MLDVIYPGFGCVADSPDVEASPFLSLLRQYMQREPVMLEGSIVSDQERCQLEDEAVTACTQLNQAVVQKQGMMQTQAVPQTGASCALTQNLALSIASAVEVRPEQYKAAILPDTQLSLQAVCWTEHTHALRCTAKFCMYGTMHV